tara:strand:+ start:241 stop:495 length:255 start_codon:yes stop_codon:yes gene_type:complete
MKRKTFKVAELKASANEILANEDISEEYKSGVCRLLTDVLLKTDNYNGFNFKYWLDKGYAEWVEAGSPSDNSTYLGKEFTRHYY